MVGIRWVIGMGKEEVKDLVDILVIVINVVWGFLMGVGRVGREKEIERLKNILGKIFGYFFKWVCFKDFNFIMCFMNGIKVDWIVRCSYKKFRKDRYKIMCFLNYEVKGYK